MALHPINIENEAANKLITQDSVIAELLGSAEVAYIMTARADMMSLIDLLARQGILDGGDIANALYEGRKELIAALNANQQPS